MILGLTEEKREKVILRCQISFLTLNALEITKLIGLMPSTIQTVLPAHL